MIMTHYWKLYCTVLDQSIGAIVRVASTPGYLSAWGWLDDRVKWFV